VEKNLVIVESPAKSKTIKKFLGNSFKVEASVGHIKDLPQKKLGVEVEKDFAPEYVVIKGKQKIISQLKKEAEKADKVYLAPDPDREGEAIAWHIASEIKKKNPKIFRATFNEITKDAVKQGIENAGEIDLNLVNAQQARRILDRLVGYKVSPVLWKTVYRGLSAGRVQSVALRMICEREKEIEEFVPQEYWSIQALLEKKSKESFSAKLFKIDGEDFQIPNEKKAVELKKDIEKNEFLVKEVKTEQNYRNPYPPYITSTLQQDAARRLGLSAQRTMRIAQDLYEGIEIGNEGSVGLITYMRTDSTRIAEVAKNSARKYIQQNFGEKYLPSFVREYKTKGKAQDAHEAIRPTYLDFPPEKVKSYLNKEQFKLYQLIWNRFLASQMASALYNATTVDIEAGKYWFRANSRELLFDGFLKVYQDIKEENGEEEKEEKLPTLKEKEKLNLLDLLLGQHFTKPKPRFSEASLIKELEANGVGRPSTYAQIVYTIKLRKYVIAEKRRLVPTDLGKTVNKILVENFPNIFNIEFTARMEEELDKIEEGEENWVKVLRDFYLPFASTLKKVEGKNSEIKKLTEEKSEEICEKCGSPMLIKWGRNGRFLACSGYPECKNAKPLNHKEEKELVENEKCDKCGSPLVVKSGRFGRFLACSKYPQCKFTKPITLGIKCFQKNCPGFLVEKKSKRGLTFYGCSNYPKCKYATWDKPVKIKCTQCGSDFRLEKKSKEKGEYLLCPQCNFEEAIPQEELEKAEKT
jgi:DNA topoisomerase-1